MKYILLLTLFIMDTCNICCDSQNTTNKLCSNNKCNGNICVNCISEIVNVVSNCLDTMDEYDRIIKKTEYLLQYTCPFCKTVNNNVFTQIKKLNNESFNKLINRSFNEYIYDYKLRTQEIIEDLENQIFKNERFIDFISYNLEESQNTIIKLKKQITKFENEKIDIVNQSKNKKYQCIYCNNSYNTKGWFRSHLIKKHNINNNSLEIEIIRCDMS